MGADGWHEYQQKAEQDKAGDHSGDPQYRTDQPDESCDFNSPVSIKKSHHGQEKQFPTIQRLHWDHIEAEQEKIDAVKPVNVFPKPIKTAFDHKRIGQAEDGPQSEIYDRAHGHDEFFFGTWQDAIPFAKATAAVYHHPFDTVALDQCAPCVAKFVQENRQKDQQEIDDVIKVDAILRLDENKGEQENRCADFNRNPKRAAKCENGGVVCKHGRACS